MSKGYRYGCLGDPNSGKTTFIYQAAFGYSSTGFPPTIGIGHSKINIKILDKTYDIDLIDTPGRIDYASSMVSCLRRLDAVFLFFDITDSCTFDHLDQWNYRIEYYCPNGVVKVLIGHKSDLQEKRSVSKESAQLFANNNNYTYFELSSCQKSSTKDIIECLKDITSKVPPKENPSGNSVYLSESSKPINSCKC